ncbi:MAG: hypothetical protein JWN67_3192 [Actinomycetia bacterium]|nr:hypothetical protein [Actinomycetes bacterium]
MRNDGAHELDRVVTSHGDAVVLVCSCGWVSAPARRYPAEAALCGHLRRASARSIRSASSVPLALAG